MPSGGKKSKKGVSEEDAKKETIYKCIKKIHINCKNWGEFGGKYDKFFPKENEDNKFKIGIDVGGVLSKQLTDREGGRGRGASKKKATPRPTEAGSAEAGSAEAGSAEAGPAEAGPAEEGTTKSIKSGKKTRVEVEVEGKISKKNKTTKKKGRSIKRKRKGKSKKKSTDFPHLIGGDDKKINIDSDCIPHIKRIVETFGRDNVFIVSKCGLGFAKKTWEGLCRRESYEQDETGLADVEAATEMNGGSTKTPTEDIPDEAGLKSVTKSTSVPDEVTTLTSKKSFFELTNMNPANVYFCALEYGINNPQIPDNAKKPEKEKTSRRRKPKKNILLGDAKNNLDIELIFDEIEVEKTQGHDIEYFECDEKPKYTKGIVKKVKKSIDEYNVGTEFDIGKGSLSEFLDLTHFIDDKMINLISVAHEGGIVEKYIAKPDEHNGAKIISFGEYGAKRGVDKIPDKYSSFKGNPKIFIL